MTNEVAAKKVKKVEMEMDDLDDYQNELKDLWFFDIHNLLHT